MALSNKRREVIDLIKGVMLMAVSVGYVVSVTFPEMAALFALFIGVLITIVFIEVLIYMAHKR